MLGDAPAVDAGSVRVLVVSDDPRIRAVASSLPAGQYKVEITSSAAEGLSLLQQHPTGVAILESQLAAKGGWAVVKDARTSGVVDVAILMLIERPSDRWLALRSGADETLIKPIDDPETLRRAIDAVGDRKQTSLPA